MTTVGRNGAPSTDTILVIAPSLSQFNFWFPRSKFPNAIYVQTELDVRGRRGKNVRVERTPNWWEHPRLQAVEDELGTLGLTIMPDDD